MSKGWVEAGGEYQIPFMGVASKSLKGDSDIKCPKCAEGKLRNYFHIINKNNNTGTIWVWCPCCRTVVHLPRVKPKGLIFPDPFIKLSLEEFAELELNKTESFLDKLNRLWDEGRIGYPNTQE